MLPTCNASIKLDCELSPGVFAQLTLNHDVNNGDRVVSALLHITSRLIDVVPFVGVVMGDSWVFVAHDVHTVRFPLYTGQYISVGDYTAAVSDSEPGTVAESQILPRLPAIVGTAGTTSKNDFITGSLMFVYHSVTNSPIQVYNQGKAVLWLTVKARTINLQHTTLDNPTVDPPNSTVHHHLTGQIVDGNVQPKGLTYVLTVTNARKDRAIEHCLWNYDTDTETMSSIDCRATSWFTFDTERLFQRFGQEMVSVISSSPYMIVQRSELVSSTVGDQGSTLSKDDTTNIQKVEDETTDVSTDSLRDIDDWDVEDLDLVYSQDWDDVDSDDE